jgi:hypothetical protein
LRLSAHTTLKHDLWRNVNTTDVAKDSVFYDRNYVIVGVSAIVVLPICLLPLMSALARTSLLSMLAW